MKYLINNCFLEILINKLNWVADTLNKSKNMHHEIVDNFKNNEKSKELVCILKNYYL